MRVNTKLYEIANEVVPFETQNFDDRTVELYDMDSFVGVKEEFIDGKGQFAVWASNDGKNYRVFFEMGYYNVVKELYCKEINKIWVDYWDTADMLYRNYTKRFVTPTTIISIAAVVGTLFIPYSWSIWVSIGIMAVALIAMMVMNKRTNNAITRENINSRELISQKIGKDKFDALLEAQKDYMDTYFDNRYKNDEENQEENAKDENAAEIDIPEAEIKEPETIEQSNDEEKA